MEAQDGVHIHTFGICNEKIGIENTTCFSYSLQINTKVPSSEMKVMADYSDKRHSEVSAEYLSRK